MMNRATFSAPLCATALLALVAVSFGEAQAQSAVITGKVTGRQGEALGGAIVVIDEFSAAVATTTQGTYTLTVAPERTKGQTVTLRARYIGYSPGVKQVTLTPGTQTQDFELKFDPMTRSEEHTSELQSQSNLVCRLLLEKKKQLETKEQLDHR